MKYYKKKMFFVVTFFLSAIFYVSYHYNNVKLDQSYLAYNMIDSLSSNEKKYSKYYAKKVLNMCYFNNFYSDLSLLLIYEDFKEKNKEKKILKICKKIVKKKRLLLNDIGNECDKILRKDEK